MFKKNTAVQDKMIAHMNEKYDDTFYYAAPFGGGLGAQSKQIICTSEKFPDSQIWVSYTLEGEVGEYHDNYVAVKYEAQTRELIGKVLKEVFGNACTFQYEVVKQAETIGSNNVMTFEEYIAQPSSEIGFLAKVDGSYSVEQEKVAADLQAAVAKYGICISIGNIEFSDRQRYVFFMNDNQKIQEGNWR